MNIPGSQPLPHLPGEHLGPLPEQSLVMVNVHLTHVAYFQEVVSYLAERGMTVHSWNPKALMMRVVGKPSAINAAFNVKLEHHSIETSDKTYHTHDGEVVLPNQFLGKIEAVIGLDSRPIARPHFRIGKYKSWPYTFGIGQRTMTAQPELPVDICKAYQVPKYPAILPLPAKIPSTAIIELGGDYLDSDTQASCQAQGIKTPNVTHKSGDNSGPSGGGVNDDATAEVHLDVQWVMSVFGYANAPCNIDLWWAENSSAGYIGAINDIAVDPNPIGVSTSWGGPDETWQGQERAMMTKALQLMATNGKTFHASAGDDGATDGTNAITADFPASSAYAFCCNGSTLYIDTQTGLRAKETVWNNGAGNGATGGAVSNLELLPAYQENLPANLISAGHHVAADLTWVADPDTAGLIWLGGQPTPIAGTSGSSPAYAAQATLNSMIIGKPLGDWHQLLYTLGLQITNDITEGDNNGYSAGVGYDVCTGWGSLNGTALLAHLSSTQPIPVPTPTPTPTPTPVPTPVPVPTPTPTGPTKTQAQAAIDAAFVGLVKSASGGWLGNVRVAQCNRDHTAMTAAIAQLFGP